MRLSLLLSLVLCIFTITANKVHAASLHVNTIVDEDGTGTDCSLREAVKAAELDAAYGGCRAGSGVDHISILAPGTISLGNNTLVINSHLTIRGRDTIIEADVMPLLIYEYHVNLQDLTIQATGGVCCTTRGVVAIQSTLTFRNVVIKYMKSTGEGGGLNLDRGFATIYDSQFSNNEAQSGAGIYAINSQLTMHNSVVSDNAASSVGGGILTTNTRLFITGSSIVNNTASSFSAGIQSFITTSAGEVDLLIQNSTISGNESPSFPGGVRLVNQGTGFSRVRNTTIYNNSPSGIKVEANPTSMYSSISAGNDQFDVRGTFLSEGYNFVDRLQAATGFTHGVNNDIVGMGDPLLGPLLDNGRFFNLLDDPIHLTHLPYDGSPVVDNGSCSLNGVSMDQRRAIRPVDVINNSGTPAPNADDGCDIGSIEAAIAELPVELVNFEAKLAGNDVVLTWTTLSEENNSHFDVEQEWNEGFKRLGSVNGIGSSSTMQDYQFVIPNVDPGTHTYRLKQVDFSGQTTFSDLLVVETHLPEAYFLSEAFPNPFSTESSFTLRLKNDQTVSISLFDAAGREVQTIYNGRLEAKLDHHFKINASPLSSGYYIYRISSSNFSENKGIHLIR